MEAIYFKCIEKDMQRQMKLIEETMIDWLQSNAMLKIVRAFGGESPETSDLNTLIEWFITFSDTWDYRKKQQTALKRENNEGARWLLNDSEITREQGEAVYAVIEELGLADIQDPMEDGYDYVIVLGGARLSCLLRTRYASNVIDTFSTYPKAAIMLSGMRPVLESEKELTNTYAPDAVTEFDLINKGAEIAFCLKGIYTEERDDNSENVNMSWARRTYTEEHMAFPVISLSGPSTEPNKRRANTSDTFKFLIEKLDIKQGQKLLLITSQIYVPYQQLEAIRMLTIPYGIIVETIGFPNEWSGNTQGMHQATNYLQEIRSTIQAMKRFTDTINIS